MGFLTSLRVQAQSQAVTLVKVAQSRLGGSPDYSHLGLQAVLSEELARVSPDNEFCVDIGAGNGVGQSNTRALFDRGWSGLALEYEPGEFRGLARHMATLPQVTLARLAITPDNVVPLLRVLGTPAQFALLDLDIDSYDHYVLASILEDFRPSLVCAEINETIPPPLRFAVRFAPGRVFGGGHFYGQSISKLHELAVANDYDLVALHYNNALLVPAERNRRPALTPEEAYEAGYLEKPDRREAFPWNADMEPLLGMPPGEAVEWLERRFADHAGEFSLSL